MCITTIGEHTNSILCCFAAAKVCHCKLRRTTAFASTAVVLKLQECYLMNEIIIRKSVLVICECVFLANILNGDSISL